VSVAVDVPLALAVACASLGAAGFAMPASEDDRLHCVVFVAVGALRPATRMKRGSESAPSAKDSGGERRIH
jgi:hypothetical protein